VVEENYLYKATALGHPLIDQNERVTNHFEIQKKGAVVVLTGSNMSGKSTFLRTVGVNAVLAGMGGSVCADSMQIGDFSLFTSMRTTDSLEQHVSSFYAELERISQLIEQLKQGLPTLFLLDELLKGTNSQDRHLGSSTLIRQLHQGPAFGIISTHDLSLGELSQHHQDIDNFSFNSELRAGKLSFDYKLQHGLCKSFNASELMAQMGIDIEKGHGDH
jgi:DNA mismatch repair ATPase MutS